MNNVSILYVEDDPFYATLTIDFLKSLGIKDITHVDNGIEGFKEIFDKKLPDLVILDYHLGRVDGMDILKKANAFNPDMNIVFLSAQKKVQVAIDSLKYGAIDYLIKDEEAFPKLKEIVTNIAKNKKGKGKFRLFKK